MYSKEIHNKMISISHTRNSLKMNRYYPFSSELEMWSYNYKNELHILYVDLETVLKRYDIKLKAHPSFEDFCLFAFKHSSKTKFFIDI